MGLNYTINRLRQVSGSQIRVRAGALVAALLAALPLAEAQRVTSLEQLTEDANRHLTFRKATAAVLEFGAPYTNAWFEARRRREARKYALSAFWTNARSQRVAHRIQLARRVLDSEGRIEWPEWMLLSSDFRPLIEQIERVFAAPPSTRWGVGSIAYDRYRSAQQAILDRVSLHTPSGIIGPTPVSHLRRTLRDLETLAKFGRHAGAIPRTREGLTWKPSNMPPR